MNKINFQNGTLVSKAKVTINGTVYEVESAEYEGTTPLNAENLNQIQTNAENSINTVQSNLNTTNQNIENLTTYSTEEKVVGTWIDGKPLYRRVVTKTTTSDSDTIDITDIPFDYLKMDGRAILTPGQANEYRVEPYYQSSSDYVRAPFVKLSEKKIAINSKALAGAITRKWIIILEYTKTTD